MKRKPRNASDGVFAGGMGLDIAFQGVIITLLVLASFFAGVYFDMGYIDIADMIAGNADAEGVTMAFITLSMVEIFHSFNMRSRRASIFSMKSRTSGCGAPLPSRWCDRRSRRGRLPGRGLRLHAAARPRAADRSWPASPDHPDHGGLQGHHAQGREGRVNPSLLACT